MGALALLWVAGSIEIHALSTLSFLSTCLPVVALWVLTFFRGKGELPVDRSAVVVQLFEATLGRCCTAGPCQLSSRRHNPVRCLSLLCLSSRVLKHVSWQAGDGVCETASSVQAKVRGSPALEGEYRPAVMELQQTFLIQAFAAADGGSPPYSQLDKVLVSMGRRGRRGSARKRNNQGCKS